MDSIPLFEASIANTWVDNTNLCHELNSGRKLLLALASNFLILFLIYFYGSIDLLSLI